MSGLFYFLAGALLTASLNKTDRKWVIVTLLTAAVCATLAYNLT